MYISTTNIEWLCTFQRQTLSSYVHFNDTLWVVMYISTTNIEWL